MGLLDAPAQRRLIPAANTVAFTGDSIFEYGGATPITTGSGTAQQSYASFSMRGPWVWAQVFTNQRLKFLGNYGVHGETLVQIVARIATPLALSPGFLVIEGGTNDVNASATAATIEAAWTTAIRSCTARGVVPVVCNIPPRGNNTAAQDIVKDAANDWLATNGPALGAIVVDIHSPVISPLSTGDQGNWADNYSIDHIHPAAPGAQHMGYAIAQAISPFLTGPKPVKMKNNTLNLMGSSFGTNPADTTLDSGWTSTTVAGSAATYSLTQYLHGADKWQQMVNATGTNKNRIYRERNTTAGFAVGDTLTFACEFESDADWDLTLGGTGGAQNFNIGIQAYTAANALIANSTLYALNVDTATINGENFGLNPRAGVLITPGLLVPATTDHVRVWCEMFGGGTIRWRAPTLTKS